MKKQANRIKRKTGRAPKDLPARNAKAVTGGVTVSKKTDTSSPNLLTS